MAERPRELGNVKGWVNLRLNPMFRAIIYGPLHSGMVILQLCLWKISHKDTLQQKLKLNVIFKTKVAF